jgi:DHA2 family multidrug resistance protein
VALTSPGLQTSVPAFCNPATQLGLAALDEEVTRQASLLAYLNDLRIMMIAAMVAMPLLLLMRKQNTRPDPAIDAHALE